MASMMGLEVIESTLNPNLSVGNQFIFLEDFTHTGLDVNWTIDPRWSVRACVLNGWDVAVDNNRREFGDGPRRLRAGRQDQPRRDWATTAPSRPAIRVILATAANSSAAARSAAH